jgi:hypothetical protein
MMPVTRDTNTKTNVPAEIANLVQTFDHCTDGHPASVVLNASLQMLAASIRLVCKYKGATLPETTEYTTYIADMLHQTVRSNWDRAPSPNAIEVRLG